MKKIKIFIILILISIFFISCATVSENTPSYANVDKSNICNVNITVTGKGAPPINSNLTELQKYLFSERAAILDGYRLIAEKLSGVIVKSQSLSKDFQLSKDSIDTSTSTFIKGVKIVSIKHRDNGVCEALMQVSLTARQLNKLVGSPVDSKIGTCNVK